MSDVFLKDPSTSHTDFLQTFIFENHPIRGAVIHLESSLSDLFNQHHYSLSQKKLLSESVAASVLMTSHLKFSGLLSLQAKGQNAIKLLSCECNDQLGYRALLTADDFGSQTFNQIFQGATLAITIEPDKGNRYQGIVPIEGKNLEECLQYYFLQSEQLPTLFHFASDGKKTVGLMLQLLPNANNTQQESWNHIKLLVETLSSSEMLTLNHHDWLHRLFHEEITRLFEKKPVSFHCSCSKERFERALISFGADTLNQMIIEDGKIETECQFCHTKYHFSDEDIKQLVLSGTKKTDH